MIINPQTPKEPLENNAAGRDETFIAVFNDEAVGEPTAKVEQSEHNTVDLTSVKTSDNLQEVTELEFMNEDEEDEIIYR